MAEVDTSIYRNQPDPLGTAGKVFGILNTAQQNQLLQTATQQRQLELQQNYATGLYGTVAPMANIPGVTQAQVRAAGANYARQVGMPPAAYQNFDKMFSGPDWKTNLSNLAVRSLGPAGLLPRETATDQQGRTSSVPSTSIISRPIATGIGPAATAAQTAVGGGAGQLLAGQGTEATDFRNQVNPLEQAIPALERLGKTGTGPGKEEINRMKSMAVSFGFAPEGWTGSVKDFDEAQKYLVQQARTMGNTGTNDQLAAAFSGNPNMKMSNAAAVDVAKTVLSLRRMKHMQLQEFYNTGQPPEQFTQWAAQWNARHDPRAFGFDHMTVDQRKKVLGSLPQAKKSQFMMDVDAADKAGVLSNQ